MLNCRHCRSYRIKFCNVVVVLKIWFDQNVIDWNSVVTRNVFCNKVAICGFYANKRLNFLFLDHFTFVLVRLESDFRQRWIRRRDSYTEYIAKITTNDITKFWKCRENYICVLCILNWKASWKELDPEPENGVSPWTTKSTFKLIFSAYQVEQLGPPCVQASVGTSFGGSSQRLTSVILLNCFARGNF